MAKYKLIEVIKTSEKETQSIYDFDTIEDATARMHNDFGVALKQEGTLATYCVIVDNDTVDITNKNRQVIALDSTIGKKKTDALKNRLY